MEAQNLAFRVYLKAHADEDELDEQFVALHKELFEGYDCCKCSNCCKVYTTDLNSAEVGRIATYLKTSKEQFIAEYLVHYKEDSEQFSFKQKNPCAFLQEDGRCRIYEVRPAECVGYPFTDRPNRLCSMWSVIEHAENCPVVFEILERLKEIYGFRKTRRSQQSAGRRRLRKSEWRRTKLTKRCVIGRVGSRVVVRIYWRLFTSMRTDYQNFSSYIKNTPT